MYTECCFQVYSRIFCNRAVCFINFRYDARGTLFDLKVHEAPQGGFNRTEGLTSEERHLEKLCDQERYFALYKDEAEEAVIKEEEIKRLNQDLNEVTSEEVTYNQVPFSYSTQQVPMLYKSISCRLVINSYRDIRLGRWTLGRYIKIIEESLRTLNWFHGYRSMPRMRRTLKKLRNLCKANWAT